MKTVIITFSSRADGNCSQIGKLIASVSKDPVLFDFSMFDIHPCGRCAAECFAEREACPFFADKEKEILETVIHSDMVYFVLPNYCDYPNANFFIFNERSQCFFQGRPQMLELYLDVPKRGIVVSSTNKDNFIQALAYHSNSEPEILFLSAKEYGKNSIRGDLLESEEAQKDIRQFICKPLKKHETTELTEEKKMNILIETDRLYITEMTMDMAMDVHKNSLDEDIRRFVPDEVFETPEDARETVEFLMSQYGSADGPLVYAVILKEGDKNIGYVQLVPLGEGKWENGYHVAKPYTCKGYATEAVTAFLPVMAEKVGINEVYGIRLLENAASGRVLEKCGFKTFFVGESQYHDGVYAISKSVWKAAIMEDEIKTVMPEEKKEVLTPSAAILIPIVRENDEPALLMEVRSMNVWQPGEICFPGGHIEAGEDCVDTALRETYEELGIRPSSVSVLQRMDPERHMEKMLVYPVLGKIDPFEPDRLLLRKEEVSEVFTVPFAWLLSHEPAVYDISDPESEELPVILRQYLRNYRRRGTRKTTYYWAYEGYGIWGLTARLLVRFRELLLAGEYPLTRK